MGVMDQSDLLKELRIDSRQREDAGGASRWPWIAGAIVLAIALGVGAAWFLFGGKTFEVQAATATAPAAGGGDTAVLQATGYVTARREATVSAQITGTLTQVLIEEGEHVDKDQVLAHLDDTAQKAMLAQAQAQASAGQATLGQYQAQLAQAQRDLKRAQDLIGRHLVSQQALEDAQTQVSALTAQVDAQRKQIELAQAGVKAAQVQLDYCTVRAPFAGVVIAKNAQVGEIVSPFSAGGGFTRTGVGTIVDMDSLEVDVDVNEAYIGRVKPDMAAEAVLDAYPDWKIPAHVIAIVPTADRGKATIKVRVALEKKDARIVPDMGVRVSFLEAKPQAAAQAPQGVLVPATAIVQRDGHSVVFVVADGRARQRTVNPAAQAYGELRLLPAAVKPGDSVVLAPPAGLRDGSDVRIEPGKS